jgi:hypothetical protein
MAASEGKAVEAAGKGAPGKRGSGLSDLSEDTLGFGTVELRTARDLLLRPGAVLDAYDSAGPTGGGRYTRALKFYLALSGLMLVISFLFGGMETFFRSVPEQQLGAMAAASGKSVDAFIADADNWSSVLVTPIYALFSAATLGPLIAWWTRSGWRRSFRAGFAFLSAWTLPLLLTTPLAYNREHAVIASSLTIAVAVITLVRIGRGRWWRTRLGGVGKTALFTAVLLLMTAVSSFATLGLSLVGARFGP